jgi:RNA polymerase sigma-70 factor (ECF subfamily)
MFSVTRHLALNLLRNQARETPFSEDHEMPAEEDGFDAQAHSARIHRCLEQLDPQRRSCILHAYVDGYSHAQISTRWTRRWARSKPGSNAASTLCGSAWDDH